jgi:voltage-gated potassium channel
MPYSLHLLTGLAGVADNERTAARRWGKRFELPMILLALWILIEWYLREKGIYSELFGRITDWGVWLFFVLETVTLTLLVEDKPRYLRSNWMNLLIICVGLPLLWGGGTYAAALRALRVRPAHRRHRSVHRKRLARHLVGLGNGSDDRIR